MGERDSEYASTGIINKVHPPDEIEQKDIFQDAKLKLATRTDSSADEIDGKSLISSNRRRTERRI